jgi:hypothetical protein
MGQVMGQGSGQDLPRCSRAGAPRAAERRGGHFLVRWAGAGPARPGPRWHERGASARGWRVAWREGGVAGGWRGGRVAWREGGLLI